MITALTTVGKMAAIPAALLGGVLFAILFGGVLTILFYIFKSIGIYTISKRRGVSAPGLGWIPILDRFTLGRVADDIRKRDGAKHSGFGVWILILELVELAGGISIGTIVGKFATGSLASTVSKSIAYAAWIIPVAVVMGMCAIALIVLELIVLAYVYKLFSGAYIALVLLSFFFSFLIPIFLFAIRKNETRDDIIDDYYTE